MIDDTPLLSAQAVASCEGSSQPFVTVITPVLNDPERLRLCLEALETQTYPNDHYEVVVVDNGSDEDIREVAGLFRQVIIGYEERRGYSAARNKGLALARGEIIAFVDADCIAAADWIDKGVAHLLRAQDCGIIAGNISIFFKDPDHPNAVELYERVTAFPQREFVEKYHFSVTANLFTFKRIFEQVDKFNLDLTSGEDYEWSQRVHAAGYRIVYADDVRVAHPARSSIGQLHRKLIRVLAGIEDVKGDKGYMLTDLVKGIVKDTLLPWKAIRRIWAAPELHGLEQKCKVVLVMLCVRYVRAWCRIQVQLTRHAQGRLRGNSAAL